MRLTGGLVAHHVAGAAGPCKRREQTGAPAQRLRTGTLPQLLILIAMPLRAGPLALNSGAMLQSLLEALLLTSILRGFRSLD